MKRFLVCSVLFTLPICLTSGSANAVDGWANCRSGDAEARITACTKLIESKSLSGKRVFLAYHYRGAAFRKIGRFSRSIADQSFALKRPWPKKVRANLLIHRGLAYYGLRDVISALKDFKAATDLAPNNWHAHYYRARTLNGSAAPSAWQAVYMAIRFAKTNKQKAMATLLLGHQYRKTSNTHRAKSYYRDVIKLAPGHWSAEEAKRHLPPKRCCRPPRK